MVAIKIWWRNFKDRAKNCLLDTNGCTVIYEALRAGGAANYVDIPHNPLGTPASLKNHHDMNPLVRHLLHISAI
jgi:hypothetical protein